MSKQGRSGDTPAPAYVFDTKRVLFIVDGDRKLLEEITGLFFEDAPKLLDRITKAVSERDSEGLWTSAHALKGAVSNFAAHAAFESAQALESMGRAADFSSAESARDRLVHELDRLKSDLTAFLGEDAD